MIAKSGAWFSYGDVRIGQGRENSKRFLAENPDLFEEIRRQVLVKRGIITEGGGGAAAAAEEPATDSKPASDR